MKREVSARFARPLCPLSAGYAAGCAPNIVRAIRLADFCEAVFVDAALEKVKQQSSAKHYQIFYLQAIKQIPPAKVAETLNVKVDQVYLIKHRLTKIFEEAPKELETKLG